MRGTTRIKTGQNHCRRKRIGTTQEQRQNDPNPGKKDTESKPRLETDSRHEKGCSFGLGTGNIFEVGAGSSFGLETGTSYELGSGCRFGLGTETSFGQETGCSFVLGTGSSFGLWTKTSFGLGTGTN